MPHTVRMKYGLLFGWGVVMYAILFLLWSSFIVYGFTEGSFPILIALFVLIILAIIAGRSLRLSSWVDILPYSVAWALIMALFDVLITVPFSGWQIYSEWSVWAGYILVVIVPLITYDGPPIEPEELLRRET